MPKPPLTIRMHADDNVAIVANDGGLDAGTALADGLVLRDRVPQGHKVALLAIPAQAPVLRYGVSIGLARQDIPAGSWVHERLLQMPDAMALTGLPIATSKPRRWRRWPATPSRATAMPMARWAPATSWPSPRQCNAWPA